MTDDKHMKKTEIKFNNLLTQITSHHRICKFFLYVYKCVPMLIIDRLC